MGAIYLFFHSLNFETFKERSEGFFSPMIPILDDIFMRHYMKRWMNEWM